MYVPLQGAESLEARVEAVRRAVWARNDELGENDQEDAWYPMDILDDAAVVRQGRQLLLVPYDFDDDGVAQFGTPEAVEMELKPVQMSAGEVRLLEGEGEKKEGWVWDVDVIAPGWALTNDYYPAEVLAEAVGLFDDSKVYAFPETRFSHHRNPLKKGPKEIVGWLSDPAVADDGRITARLNFVQAGLADELRTQLVRAWERGKRDLLGLSIDARGLTARVDTDRGPGRLVAAIKEVLSTDMVLKPAAGGKLNRLVAGEAAAEPKEESMNKKRLIALLRARRPEVLEGLDVENATAEEIMAALSDEEWDEIIQADGDPGDGDDDDEENRKAAATVQAGEGEEEEEEEDEDEPDPVRVELTEIRVRDALQASQLPELTQRRVKSRFEGTVASREEIQTAIDDEREYLAELNPARVRDSGGTREGAGISVGNEKLDRLQAAFDRAFGLEIEDPDLKTVRPIGLRRLYDEITLGHDPDVDGQISERGQRAMLQEAFTNATLPRVVANTLHRRLTMDYRELDYGEQDLISVVPAPDFKTREAVRVGYFGDLGDVDPETADYPEIVAYGEEFEQYSVGQKGNLVTITRKHIINDDVGAVAKITGRLGRAARRTFAKFVFDFLINNPLMQDGVAWFAAGHNNLITVALDGAALTAIRNLLYNQTELSSGAKLGLDLYSLWVPIDLEETAIELNQQSGGDATTVNRWHHHFGENNERIHVVPFFTDANDYYGFVNPAEGDIIEVAFLNGQEEPELFLADTPTVGEMFKGDKIQYKIRHEYGGVPVDFRTGAKAAVV